MEPLCTQVARFAEDAAWLLNHPNLVIGPDALALRYHLALRDQGFAVSTSNVDFRRFCRMFEAYASEELIRLFPCTVDFPFNVEDVIQWIQQIVLRSSYYVIPIFHLLLIQFLGYSCETFLKCAPEQELFGNGPWPCLNPGCKQFQQPVIENVDIVMLWHSSASVRGIFSCSCGFVYVRDGQDQLMDNSLDGIQILFAGPKKEQAFQRDREYYRRAWLRVRQAFPNATRKELHRVELSASIWLVKHDKDWLMAHQPEPTPSLENVLDWKQRDAELAQWVKESADYLLNRPDPPTRLTPSKILKRLDDKKLYDTYKQHLPLTAQALAESVETREACTIRTIWWAAAQYLHTDEVPSWDQILRDAGVREDKVFPVVAGAINAALEVLCRTVSSTSEK